MASNGQSEPADSSRPTPCPCRLKSSVIYGVTIFVSLFLCIPFAAWRADSAAFSWKLFEVYMWQNIMMWFLLFSLFTPVFYYGAKIGANILAGPLTAFALWQTTNYFYAYGWLSFIPAQTAAALKFWPACVADKCGAAQMLRDIVFEYHRPGEQQLIEDAAWCAITGVLFITVETGRWSLTLPYTSIPATVLAPLVPLFGYDLVLPTFILILWNAETSGRSPKPSRDLRYVYLIVCVLALVLWIPHFYEVSWEIWTGRFYKVPQNAFGLRAFWSVYGYAFTLALYIVPDTNMVTSSGPVGAVTGWVVRILYIWFMCSSIVGAWLCMLYFREITPNRSFKIARNIPSVNGNPNPFEGEEYMGAPVLKRD